MWRWRQRFQGPLIHSRYILDWWNNMFGLFKRVKSIKLSFLAFWIVFLVDVLIPVYNREVQSAYLFAIFLLFCQDFFSLEFITRNPRKLRKNSVRNGRNLKNSAFWTFEWHSFGPVHIMVLHSYILVKSHFF